MNDALTDELHTLATTARQRLVEGTAQLRDAYQGNCACAVIISNDSDLLTPIRMAKADCGMTIGLVPPRPKGSVELKRLADFKIEPRVHLLTSSQLPQSLQTPQGVVHKPANW